MDHTDQFQILTRFLNHFASTRQTVERSGEGRPWSCSVADPSRGHTASVHRIWHRPQDRHRPPQPSRAVYPCEKNKTKIQGNKK